MLIAEFGYGQTLKHVTIVNYTLTFCNTFKELRKRGNSFFSGETEVTNLVDKMTGLLGQLLVL